jgi:hypothetical protein
MNAGVTARAGEPVPADPQSSTLELPARRADVTPRAGTNLGVQKEGWHVTRVSGMPHPPVATRRNRLRTRPLRTDRGPSARNRARDANDSDVMVA